MNINIIPHKRDEISKKQYIFMKWFLRKNKKEIKIKIDEMIMDKILYGNLKKENQP